jgi:hypothetical protein
VTRECRWCKGPLPHGCTAYCSKACRDPGRRAEKLARVSASCGHCGAGFQALAFLVRTKETVYCSSKCVTESAIASGRFKGANNPRWMGGVSNDNMRYRTRQKERWPERERARRMVQDALRSGRLVRQSCEVCGDSDAHGHHDDYDQPLDVRWLCRVHHDEHHVKHGRGCAVPGAA